MTWKTFFKVALLILLSGVVLYLISPKYDFYHQDIRRNRFSGKIEEYDDSLDRWGTTKKLQELSESRKVQPSRELIDDLGILGTFEPEKPSLIKEFGKQIKGSWESLFADGSGNFTNADSHSGKKAFEPVDQTKYAGPDTLTTEELMAGISGQSSGKKAFEPVDQSKYAGPDTMTTEELEELLAASGQPSGKKAFEPVEGKETYTTEELFGVMPDTNNTGLINETRKPTKKELIYALTAALSFVLLVFLRIKRFLRNRRNKEND